jgi:hypothetical protein
MPVNLLFLSGHCQIWSAGADHLLGEERESMLDLVEPGGVDWRIINIGARLRAGTDPRR